MSCDMRTPRSTVGSYSKASCGVRFSLSSLARRAWRTLTKTRAWRRSVEVSTPVTVTNPIRGSFSSPSASASVSRIASFTRLIRSVIRAHQLPLAPDDVEVLAVQVAHRVVEERIELPLVARHAGHRQPGPLPEVVVVDLGHGGAEAVLELRLGRFDVFPLPLQRPRLGEVELDREDADEARAHGNILTEGPALGGGRSRRGWGWGWGGQIRALDLADLEDLEDVAFLHVVEALEEDAALESLLDLADVVLEALEL